MKLVKINHAQVPFKMYSILDEKSFNLHSTFPQIRFNIRSETHLPYNPCLDPLRVLVAFHSNLICVAIHSYGTILCYLFQLTLSHKIWLEGQTIRLCLQGISQEAIARQLNISEGTVNAILRQATQTNKLLPLQHEIAVELKRTGFPMTQFASNLRYKNAITTMGS